MHVVGSTICTEPLVLIIVNVNVASGAVAPVRPPFVVMSPERANSAVPPEAATGLHSVDAITTGPGVSSSRSRPRPLRSNEEPLMFVISNHSWPGSVAGFGISSLITRSPAAGLTMLRKLPPPMSHMPAGGADAHWRLSMPGVPMPPAP